MGPLVLTQLATGLSVIAGAAVVKSVMDQNTMAGQFPRCPSCNGSGRVECFCSRWSDGDVGCRSCAGSGRAACSKCGGSGSNVRGTQYNLQYGCLYRRYEQKRRPQISQDGANVIHKQLDLPRTIEFTLQNTDKSIVSCAKYYTHFCSM